MNTTTKPLFEETLNIVLECLEKYKRSQPFLPVECLKNYQLIYNENDDAERLLLDDNQSFTECLSIRYVIKDPSLRTCFHRILPGVNTNRISANETDHRSNKDNIILSLNNIFFL